MPSDEKPTLTLRDVRKACERGLLVLSIDRERLDEYRNFVTTPIGRLVEVTGFVVHLGTKTYLQVFAGVRSSRIELLGMDPRHGAALHGYPVKIVGRKIRSDAVAIEFVKRCSIARKPPTSYEYVKNVLLDGFEVSKPEDLAVLSLVSSPRIVGVGGLRKVVVGRGRSYLCTWFSKNTVSIPYVWRYRRTSKPVERSKVAELSLGIECEDPNKVLDIHADYPVAVLRASDPSQRSVDLDVVDYSVYLKGFTPRLAEPNLWRVVEDLADRIRRWVEASGIDLDLLSTPMLSIDHLGKPSTVLRIAFSIARTRMIEIVDRSLLDQAYRMLIQALENIVEELRLRPRKFVKLRDLEIVVLRAIEELEHSYPHGVPENAVVEHLKLNPSEVRNCLERLRARGFVYCPRPGTYRVVRT